MKESVMVAGVAGEIPLEHLPKSGVQRYRSVNPLDRTSMRIFWPNRQEVT
jgi:hypothetical protein